MKMMLIAVMAGLAALTVTVPAEAQVNERQWTQQGRIWQGYRSGELTTYEALRLQNRQRRINRYETRSRWDGRGLSAHERARISRMQNRASRNIYWQKHDRQGSR